MSLRFGGLSKSSHRLARRRSNVSTIKISPHTIRDLKNLSINRYDAYARKMQSDSFARTVSKVTEKLCKSMSIHSNEIVQQLHLSRELQILYLKDIAKQIQEDREARSDMFIYCVWAAMGGLTVTMLLWPTLFPRGNS